MTVPSPELDADVCAGLGNQLERGSALVALDGDALGGEGLRAGVLCGAAALVDVLGTATPCNAGNGYAVAATGVGSASTTCPKKPE